VPVLDLDDDVLDLDEPEAPPGPGESGLSLTDLMTGKKPAPQPGMLSRAWNFATTPILDHWKAAAPSMAPEIDRYGEAVEKVGNLVPRPWGMTPEIPEWQRNLGRKIAPGVVDKLTQIPRLGQMAQEGTPLDAVSSAIPSGRLGALLNAAAGAGIGAEGLAQLREAYETNDWTKVPTGLARLALGALGVSSVKGSGAADDVAKVAPTSTTTSGIPDSVPVSAEPVGFGSGSLSQSAGRPPEVPPLAPVSGTPTSLAPPPTLSSVEWRPSAGSSTQVPAGRAAPPGGAQTPPTAAASSGSTPPKKTLEQRMAEVQVEQKAEWDPNQLLDLDAPPAASVDTATASVPSGGRNLAAASQPTAPAGAPAGARQFEVGGFQATHNPKTKTVALKGPQGEKVTGKIHDDFVEMTSIGKGKAENSKTAVDALRALGIAESKPVLFTSTNLSIDGGNFRKRMLERGDLLQIDGKLVLKGTEGLTPPKLESALQKSVEIAEPLRASGASPTEITSQLKNQRSGEAGFVDPQLLVDAAKSVNRGTGDILRMSVAGDIPTAIRNVQSGLRMVGQAMFEGPIAAGFDLAAASKAAGAGQVSKSMELKRAAQLQMEASKAFAGATFSEGASTFADAISLLSGGRVKPQWGNPSGFADRLRLMENVGDKKLAKKLGDFSSTSAGVDLNSKFKKGLMFFNILGDRFINKTYLKAHVDAAQKVFGASSPQQLEQMAARNPVIKAQLQEYLTNAGSEAFRASWQNEAASGYTKALISALDNTPAGIIIQPFAKAFFANMLPNVLEKIPGVAFASKRVRNSFDFQANKTRIEQLGRMPQTPAVKQEIAKWRNENRKLAEGGIYAPSKIYARMTMGGMMLTAAVMRRLYQGDDGTEFDQMPIEVGEDGKAKKVASFTSQAGEDLPFWYLGDRIAHSIIAQREGRPSKYAGESGTTSLKGLMRAMYGSRYGVQTPAMDMIGSLISGKSKFDDDYIDRMARGISEDLGRMAGAGSWLGGTARRFAAEADPEEAKLRRGDVTESTGPLARVLESGKEGFQTQIPKNPFGLPDRTQLPESISWSKLDTAKSIDPLEPLKGGSIGDAEKLAQQGKPISALLSLVPGSTRMEVSALDRFASEHQDQISLSEILPRRTQQPAYDALVLKHLKAGLEKKALPLLESGRIYELSPESQVAWFRTLPKIREQATDRAAREFRSMTGTYPEGELERRQKEREKRVKRRVMRRELRGLD
jgi:hypothetical protein